MSKGSYRDLAPKYFAAGYSVLPTEPGEKRPAKEIANWSSYGGGAPSAARQLEWINRYPDRDITLLTGTELEPGKLVAAVDVDIDAFVAVVDTILDRPICAKRGKKGITFFAIALKEEGLRSTKLIDSEKRGAIDILINGKSTVLPPSIHPETKKPYFWREKSLLECTVSALPILSVRKFSLIKKIVASPYTNIIVGGDATHDAGYPLVAMIVALGCCDEEITAIFKALLPTDYKGNSLEELPEWIRSARRKGFGDSADPKGDAESRSTKKKDLITLLDDSGGKLFRDQRNRGFISIKLQSGGTLNLLLQSEIGRQWLRKLWFEKKHAAIAAQTLQNGIDTLDAIARFDRPTERLYLRVAGGPGVVFADLGRDDALTVRIDSQGWALTYDCPYRFYRPPGFQALPNPTPGNFDSFRALLGLDDTNAALVLAFMLNCLRPSGPYLWLAVEGEQGSGKSVMSTMIRQAIDPQEAPKLRLPDTERDLMLHAQENYLLNYDNASGMRNDISDALCSLSTGGGFAKRKYYTDDELRVFNFTRPYMINGITDFAHRPDLLDRAIPLRLQTMSAGIRRSEKELFSEYERIRPGLIGFLFDCVSCALRNEESIEIPTDIRMVDGAAWIVAAEPATGLSAGMMLTAINEAQRELLFDRATSDRVVVDILNLIDERPAVGLFGAVFDELASSWDRVDKSTPKTPQQLSRHLARLAPALRKQGVFIDMSQKTNKGRLLRIWKVGQEGGPYRWIKDSIRGFGLGEIRPQEIEFLTIDGKPVARVPTKKIAPKRGASDGAAHNPRTTKPVKPPK